LFELYRSLGGHKLENFSDLWIDPTGAAIIPNLGTDKDGDIHNGFWTEVFIGRYDNRRRIAAVNMELW